MNVKWEGKNVQCQMLDDPYEGRWRTFSAPCYAKNEQGDLTSVQLKVLAMLVREDFT